VVSQRNNIHLKCKQTHSASITVLISSPSLLQLVGTSPDIIAPNNGPGGFCCISNNSAAGRRILLKFGTEFDHVTFNTLQTFKVIDSNVKVTA